MQNFVYLFLLGIYVKKPNEIIKITHIHTSKYFARKINKIIHPFYDAGIPPNKTFFFLLNPKRKINVRFCILYKRKKERKKLSENMCNRMFYSRSFSLRRHTLFYFIGYTFYITNMSIHTVYPLPISLKL